MPFFTMQKKHLQIIIIVLAFVGMHLTIDRLFTLYQTHLSEPDDLLIALIGVIISIAWYFPFFIIAYWLYRKQKLMN